jgi:uncharacterized membrane protein YczE
VDDPTPAGTTAADGAVRAGGRPPAVRDLTVMERVRRQRPETFWWRGSLMLAGSLVSTLCYAVTIRATVGLGPLYAFQDGIADHLHIAIGTSVMLTGVAFVFVALCLRTRPGPGTLVLPFFGGWTLDLMLPHIPAIRGAGWQYLAVVLASWFMAMGGAMVFRAAVGVSSYDSIMLGLHRVTGRRLAPLRLGMEITMFVTGWLLGGAVGWGSVITGVLIGPGLQFWIRVFGGIPGEAANRAIESVEPTGWRRAAAWRSAPAEGT